MAKLKSHKFIIDNLSEERAEKIKKALQEISKIKSITINIGEGTVELLSAKDHEEDVKLACEIAGAVLRIKIKKRGLF